MDGWTFEFVPRHIVRIWFDEWKTMCWWNKRDYSEDVVYDAWLKVVRRLYADALCTLRKPKKTKNPSNPTKWVKSDILNHWKHMWDDMEYTKKREKAQKNRRGGNSDAPALPTHVGGSLSAINHAVGMVKNGVPPTPDDVFRRMHRRNDNTYVTPRAQQIATRYEEIMALANDGDMLANSYYAYREASGGLSRKRRVFGLGRAAAEYYGDSDTPNYIGRRTRARSSSSSSAGEGTSSTPNAQLQATVDRLVAMCEEIKEDNRNSQAAWERWREQQEQRNNSYQQGIDRLNLSVSDAEIERFNVYAQEQQRIVSDFQQTIEQIQHNLSMLQANRHIPSPSSSPPHDG